MAKRETVSEKLVKFVIIRGYEEILSRSKKYRTFEKEGVPVKVFIGKRGAFRSGRTSSNSRSVFGVSVTHERIDRLLAKASE